MLWMRAWTCERDAILVLNVTAIMTFKGDAILAASRPTTFKGDANTV
jgi:hypothetical protein